MEEREFLMLKDVARSFGVSTACVRNWVNEKKLRALITPGGHRRIRKSDFEDFVKKYQRPTTLVLN